MAGGSRELASGGQPVKASTAELRNVAGQRLAVWQWYWIGGRLTSSDHLAKLWQAVHRLLGEGDDSAVVILYAPKEDQAALADFAAGAMGSVERTLQAARGR